MSPHNSRHDAPFWIETLALTRHPEGGWFRETYRSAETIPAPALPARFGGARCFGTAILFLLQRGDISALHCIRSDEIWHFHEGAALRVHMITPQGEQRQILLGRDPARGESFQAVAPAGCWFGAETLGDFSLVGCSVAPGFDFQDFRMADRTELTGRYPRHAALIQRLTR